MNNVFFQTQYESLKKGIQEKDYQKISSVFFQIQSNNSAFTNKIPIDNSIFSDFEAIKKPLCKSGCCGQSINKSICSTEGNVVRAKNNIGFKANIMLNNLANMLGIQHENNNKKTIFVIL